MTAEDVLTQLGGAAVLSHETAARLHGLDLFEDAGLQRVTVPRSRHGSDVPGWRVHRADVAEADITAEGGARCTDAARTVADLARVLPLREAVVAADSALRLGLVQLGDLSRLRDAKGRGASLLRTVHAAVDPKSGSVLETLLRTALAEAGLPRPVTQFHVVDHGHEVARVDFCWPGQRLIVEADGFAFHSNRAHYRRDRQHMNELERLGWRVLRFTWEDVVDRPEHVVGLVRACLAQDLGSAA